MVEKVEKAEVKCLDSDEEDDDDNGDFKDTSGDVREITDDTNKLEKPDMLKQQSNGSLKEMTKQIIFDKQKAIRQLRAVSDEYVIIKPLIYFIQEIGKQIGRGGYGKVYEAVHKQSHIKRAIKKIKKNNDDQQSYKQIINELELLKKLDHPNLVKLIEFYEDDDHLYLIQEFLSGDQLFEQLSNNDFNEEKARKIFKQVLMAISFIHSKNVSHRDIKPENFVFENRESDTVKLIDFGLSSSFVPQKEQNLNKSLVYRRMRTPVGTSYYAAPEIYSQEYSEKCDIWSAGVMLYVLLCGYPPFYVESGNQTKIQKKVQKGKIKFAGEIWSTISNQAKDLVTKMLVRENERPNAKQCLDHDWFFVESSQLVSNIQITQSTIETFQSYTKKTFFKQCVQYLIAYRCNMSEDIKKMQQISKIFQKIDHEQQGYVTFDQVKEFFKDYFESEEELLDYYNQMDLDKDQKVHWHEFLSTAITNKIIYRVENLKEIYYFFDAQKKGYITSDDFKIAIADQHLNYINTNYENVIEESFGGKKQITFEDFLDFMQEDEGKYDQIFYS